MPQRIIRQFKHSIQLDLQIPSVSRCMLQHYYTAKPYAYPLMYLSIVHKFCLEFMKVKSYTTSSTI